VLDLQLVSAGRQFTESVEAGRVCDRPEILREACAVEGEEDLGERLAAPFVADDPTDLAELDSGERLERVGGGSGGFGGLDVEAE